MRTLNTIIIAMFSLLVSLPVLAEELTLASNDFLDTGILPVLYTCDGKNFSPEINWSNPPSKTQSFTLTLMDDPHPNKKSHYWLVYNIPTTAKNLGENLKSYPSGAQVGKNSWNTTQYRGPCPLKGTSNTYLFTLYALDTKLKLPAGADSQTALNAMQGHVLQKANLTAVYIRWVGK